MGIIRFNFDYLMRTKRDMVYFHDEFKVTSSRKKFELGWRNKSEINEYICNYVTAIIPSF